MSFWTSVVVDGVCKRLGRIRKSEERGFEEKCWLQVAEPHAEGAESKYEEFPPVHAFLELLF